MTIVESEPDLWEGAKCREPDVDPEWWFAEAYSDEKRKAVSLCKKCPVINECLEYALQHKIPFGIWGGMPHPSRIKLYYRERHRIDDDKAKRIIVDVRHNSTKSCGSKVWFN